jgi:glycine cleavage system H lipoate-binding protein
MTVLLVLITFAVFIAFDYLLHKKELKKTEAQPESTVSPALKPAFVEGFLLPENLRYHPGHSWLHRERRNLARVGADEFAAALAGKIDSIELPKPGQWVRQGQKVIAYGREGLRAEMVSPTEGEVVEINQDVLKDPTLLRKDPYGQGWLMTIHVPDEEGTSRNLVPTSLVKNWMRNAAERLYAMQNQSLGLVAADGGRPVDDLLSGIPAADWKKITDEFFLS